MGGCAGREIGRARAKVPGGRRAVTETEGRERTRCRGGGLSSVLAVGDGRPCWSDQSAVDGAWGRVKYRIDEFG